MRWWTQLAISPLLQSPLASRAFWDNEISAQWRKMLNEHPGALLHFDSPDLSLFAKDADGFRKLLNHHNCESAMAERRAELEKNPIKKAFLREQARKLEQVEQTICGDFGVNAVVSQHDGLLLQARNQSAHIHVVENGTDTTYFCPPTKPVEPNTVVFAGSLSWYPNSSAMRFFSRQIWPVLKERCRDAHFYLAGNSPPKWMAEWAAKDKDITLVARPADIRPWVDRAAVFVCPIVDGGGTRLKILDAMAMGKAVVSTSIGCEGLRVKDGENIMVADSPEDFVSAIHRLSTDTSLRERIAAAGRELVEKEYDWRIISARLKQAYACVLDPTGCDQRLDEVGAVRQ